MKNLLRKSKEKLKNTKAHVFVTAAILSAAFTLALMDSNRRYAVDTTVVLLPKSELAAVQLDKITGNIAAFPRMLSFYDRLLSDNPKMPDAYEGEEDGEREEFWKGKVAVATKRFSRSSLVTVSVSAPTKTEAETLAKKTTQTLLAVASKYYNTEKDLDIRVADGPITKASVPFWGLFLILGILVGTLAALLLESALIYLEKLLAPRLLGAPQETQAALKKMHASIFSPELPEIEKIEDIYGGHGEEEAVVPAHEEAGFQELEKIHRKKQEDVYPNFPEMPVRIAKQAQAPANLPVSFEEEWEEGIPANLPILEEPEKFEMPREKKLEMEEEIVPEKEAESAPQTRKEEEPTAEELKRRLNQLLRGEL